MIISSNDDVTISVPPDPPDLGETAGCWTSRDLASICFARLYMSLAKTMIRNISGVNEVLDVVAKASINRIERRQRMNLAEGETS